MRLKLKAADDVPRKKCRRCRKVKPLTEFHKYTGRSKDGHRNICIACRRKIEKVRIQQRRIDE